MDLTDEAAMSQVESLLKPIKVEINEYRTIMKRLSTAMTMGLQLGTRESTSVKMYPSYVMKLPNGSETGQFLALDLGGTNYRVILVSLFGTGVPPKIEERTYAIPKETMLGTGQDLFAYLASTLDNFLKRRITVTEEIPLGFTFSFPCEQTALDKAYLVRWTKGFAATDVQGENIASLLQSAINATGMKVRCVAVVNDTVGTLASCSLEDTCCAVGLIVGTGTNAAYIERQCDVEMVAKDPVLLKAVPSGDEKESLKNGIVVINTEWGAFGEAGELNEYLTAFDKRVDAASIRPGKQLFEKLVSGMYLGEIVRQVLLELISQKLLFRGDLPESLQKPYSFHTKYITETERDPAHLFYSTNYMLTEDLNVPEVEPIDSQIVRLVCETVSTRAAYLVGTGISAILHRLNRPKVTVGVDGSLYKFHPRFRERMTDIIDKLRPEGVKFRLRLSEDGSGKGAAAIAAAAVRK